MKPAAFLALSAALFGCGGSPDAGADADQALADAMGAAGASMPLSLEPFKLEERDVERFISVLEDLKRLGVEYGEKVGPDPSAAGATMQGWGANAEAMAILRDHDLDMMEFQRLSYTVMMAAAASESTGDPELAAAARRELEDMKSSLTAEQYEAMKNLQQQATKMTPGMENQPEGNVELVARYREAIDAAAKRDR